MLTHEVDGVRSASGCRGRTLCWSQDAWGKTQERAGRIQGCNRGGKGVQKGQGCRACGLRACPSPWQAGQGHVDWQGHRGDSHRPCGCSELPPSFPKASGGKPRSAVTQEAPSPGPERVAPPPRLPRGTVTETPSPGLKRLRLETRAQPCGGGGGAAQPPRGALWSAPGSGRTSPLDWGPRSTCLGGARRELVPRLSEDRPSPGAGRSAVQEEGRRDSRCPGVWPTTGGPVGL